MRGALPGLCLCLALSGMASGCGAPDAPKAEETTSAGLEVREATATLLPDMGAVYLTVVNPGPDGDRLLRAETGIAQAAETHETVEENGVMRMVARPEGFEVPAGGTLELRPGGKHIMLLAPQAPARAAASIPLTLHFERAGAVEVQAAVSSGTEHEGMDHGDHGDHGHMDHGEPTPEAGKG